MDLKKFEAAYHKALSLQGSKREAFIERLRGENPDLAAKVEALLKTGGVDDGFLRESVAASAVNV